MMKEEKIYNVQRSKHPLKIDGTWEKPEWKKISPLNITNRMGEVPAFIPTVQAKMMYDHENLYVIFRVDDKFVRCVVTDFNGPVYQEPCVEFFFSPDTVNPERYFNLEINCGGTPLMHYNDHLQDKHQDIEAEDLAMINIAHTLPAVVDPEISDPVTWTIEYRLPLSMLRKYSRIDQPEPGIGWRANFYKIAEKGSNVHFLTWSPVINPVPNFHLPKYFGLIKFN